MTTGDDPVPLRRRDVLATLAAVSSTGCLQRVRSMVNRRSPEQISMTVKTVPADDDERAVEIARGLQEHLSAVGIDASIELQSESTFLREILLNNDFDLYVSRFPPREDPDFLRAMLHSSFVSEPGWQNPFGLSDLDLDEVLTDQRTSAGSARRDAVETVATTVAKRQPFSVVCFPEEATVVRTDRFGNWPDRGHLTSLDHLALRRRDAEDGSEDPVPLRVAYVDARITRNLNPIAVEYRRRGSITGLLYDPLMRRVDGDLRPWLAADVDWTETDDGTTATVSLRDGVTWHDGESLTASDVAFTYRFYDDTTLGTGDVAVPAPRFRGRTSLVESVEALDDDTVRLSFGETARSVADRALTVPILPTHVWESKTGGAELAGVDVSRTVTEALVWANTRPVGSGPLAFESRTVDEELRLSRFDDHFLFADPPEWSEHVPAFDELLVRVTPSDAAAVTLVTEGEVDATGTPIRPGTHDVTDHEAVEVRRGTSRSFYHVGYNVRRETFGNVRFRRLLSRLIDPAHTVATIFEGNGRPAATPLSGTGWEPPSLAWDGTNPTVPFLGTDGDLDVSAAREEFRDIGFRYDDDRLVR